MKELDHYNHQRLDSSPTNINNLKMGFLVFGGIVIDINLNGKLEASNFPRNNILNLISYIKYISIHKVNRQEKQENFEHNLTININN